MTTIPFVEDQHWEYLDSSMSRVAFGHPVKADMYIFLGREWGGRLEQLRFQRYLVAIDAFYGCLDRQDLEFSQTRENHGYPEIQLSGRL